MTELPRLTGPSLKPTSGGKPASLVVLLHGVGADGNDLIGLAPYWAPLLPDTEFLSPDAPFPCDMAPHGRQWFSLADRSPAPILAGVKKAAPILDRFLDEALAERGLDDSRLALVGFSQGTMMSLYVGLRRAKTPAGIVGYSGALVAPQLLAGEIRARPPVLLVHGTEDPIVPVAALGTAVKALDASGIKVESLASPGIGHSIDEQGLTRGGEFLRGVLKR
ncbi:MAG TPA: prolyl oligopeptidase family serine peptidase [Stellaceae bacterium]|nr:prolyl oligopeptidase family serine peptidase [Stellaceae bacterium]